MKFNTLLVALMKDHTPMSSDEQHLYKVDMDKVYDEVDTEEAVIRKNKDLPEDEKIKSTWKNKAKSIAENPYARTGFVILYFYLFRKISDWKNGVIAPPDESDNDFDDYDDADDQMAIRREVRRQMAKRTPFKL